jgi:hypothetical protein
LLYTGEMPRATVKEFDLMKGFGTLVLESGEELLFDSSASNKREPKAGEQAEVTIGVGWKGKPKAKLVVFATEEDRAPSFTSGLEQLRAFGFFQQWDVNQARAAARELWDQLPERLTRGDVGGLMQLYYGEGTSERGRAEGVITLDRRYGQVTEQPIADVCAICPEPVTVEHELGEDLLPLLAALNAALAARSSAHRYFSLDVDSDFYVIVCRSADFDARIATTGWLKLG